MTFVISSIFMIFITHNLHLVDMLSKTSNRFYSA